MARPKRKRDAIKVQLPFKTAEVSRAIRGVLNMGLWVSRIEIDPRSGAIAITPSTTPPPATHSEKSE